ncbi:FAD-binding oxidoreductase [Salinicola sp. DM10]|uniref:NAD(P)/FAD-dependent oxidoreductase n=1 Tax=Salinicola sp. DM10 TaxID=2815721 RepID=UPI001A8EA845|nr:FAD-binding oxidoreductase [Salinicola sp. DM10]MCE3026865.1 FAD-binding oxidoreductase [Salinicola sp. DM10]
MTLAPHLAPHLATHPAHRSACGWQALLPARPPGPSQRGDERADLVIVGAGYTGVAAARAYQALAPERRVVMLEAERVGDGSPGRNSGFMLEIALANDASSGALSRMATLNRLSREAMASLKAQVDTHAIDCQLTRSGTYRAARGAAGRAALASYAEFLHAAGLDYYSLDRAALAERLGTDYYAEGLYSPDCYLVQPAALIRGLVAALPPAVTCYEQSPALSLTRDGDGWRVTTPEGEIRTRQVMLANNAFARALGADRSRLTAIYTYAALTAPLTPAHTAAVAGTPWGLLPAHRLGCTLRTTADRRLMIRAQYDYERERDPATVAAALAASLTARYPALADVGFEQVWGGTTGLTHNGAPLWGEIGPGLYVSAGCNGGGIVKGSVLGEALARLALGRPAEDIPALFGRASWMPPAPIRRLAFEAIRRVEQRRGREEA